MSSSLRVVAVAFALLYSASLLASPAAGVVFTVGGPQGTSTFDQALTQSTALVGLDEIRVHAGDLSVPSKLSASIAAGNDLVVSGGWNDTFTSRDSAVGASRLLFGDSTAFLDIQQTGGTASFAGIGLARAPGTLGRGLLVNLSGGSLTLDGLVIADHTLVANQGGQGAFATAGGALFLTQGASTLTLQNSRFQRNATRGDGIVGSAAFALSISGDARALIQNNLVQANRAETTTTQLNTVRGAAFDIQLGGETGNPRLDFLTNKVVQNVLGGGGGNGAFGTISISSSGASTGKIVVRRLQMTGNQSTAGARSQLQVIAAKPVDTLITDSLVAKSNAAIGLDLQTFDGRFRVVNVTAVDNGGANGTGVLILDGNGVSAVSNTIAFGNPGLQLASGTLQAANLTSGNAKFVNRPAGNYHLLASSPAINKGTKTPPLGGLGTQDIDGNPRVKGAKPDIGADEF